MLDMPALQQFLPTQTLCMHHWLADGRLIEGIPFAMMMDHLWRIRNAPGGEATFLWAVVRIFSQFVEVSKAQLRMMLLDKWMLGVGTLL